MNTGKAIWLRHPKHVLTTLHSYTYEGKDDLCVMFTLGESGEMSLFTKCEKDAKAKMVFLHTPNDYLIFSNGIIEGKLFEVEYRIHSSFDSRISLKKEGMKLSFISDGKVVLEISNPAFMGSASFGVISEGIGKTYIEIF